MFTVYEKENVECYDVILGKDILKSVNVYAVRDDANGYPHFLIYENGQWKYKSAKYFTDECEAYDEY